MNFILLTESTTPIIGWISKLLGLIMNGIFYLLDLINLPYIGLAIILFTIVVNLLMLPLTIRQQKFSKLSAKMNPELQAIQAKYKNKKDNESLMAQNGEIQALYAKYGVSPSGSCVQLLIQMPILLALYNVIRSIPAYVDKIYATFKVLADHIINNDGAEFLRNSGIDSIANTVNTYGRAMDNNLTNGVIDVLNKLSSTDLATIAEHYNLTQLTYPENSANIKDLILGSDGLINTYNNFLGLNMGDSPSAMIKSAMEIGAWGIVIGAILIPVLSAVMQWINVKLMPQPVRNNEDDAASSMAASMKTMNTIMPLFSAWLCFSFPSGLGLYWVAGSVVRSIQQIVINKYIDKVDFDELIKKNSAKSAKKMEKVKQRQELLNAYANMNTRNIQSKANIDTGTTADSSESGSSSSSASSENNSGSGNGTAPKPGSIAAKANLVKEYNERNNK